MYYTVSCSIFEYIFTGHTANEALIITTDDHVYALGTNKKGCLGLGHQNSVSIATKVEALCGKGIFKFISNVNDDNMFVLALARTGKVSMI